MDDEQATKQLLDYVNSNKTPEIMNVTEDAHFVYFDTAYISILFYIKQMGYATRYQETKTGYHVRVLKPNWFSHDLLQEDKKL